MLFYVARCAAFKNRGQYRHRREICDNTDFPHTGQCFSTFSHFKEVLKQYEIDAPSYSCLL